MDFVPLEKAYVNVSVSRLASFCVLQDTVR